MDRYFVKLLLRTSAALYFSINGIMAIRKSECNEFVKFAYFIFGKNESSQIPLIFIIMCVFVGSICLLLPLLKIEIPIFNTVLFYQSFGWVFYIIGYDIIYTVLNKVNILKCLNEFAIHIMLLGIMFASLRKINILTKNNNLGGEKYVS
jgi:hypothetical protein